MESLAITQTTVEVVGVQEFLGKEMPVIEGGFGQGQKVVLAKTIAEIHQVELRKINELINNNIDEFEEGIDILDLKGDEDFAILAKDTGFYTQNALNASSNIYLLSEQGYHALVGFMRTEKSKEIRRQLRREYFAMRKAIKEEPSKLNQLSPQLQLLISMELEQKKLNKQIKEVSENLLETKNEIKEIRQVVNLDTTNWRNETRTLIAKIARKQGDLKYIRDFTNESYELLNKRFGVSLERRLTNKCKNIELKGVSKSKIAKLNNLDVIAEDKKLIEGYVTIVKDMTIKYGI